MHCRSRSRISFPRSDQFRSRTVEGSANEPWQLQPDELDPDESPIRSPPGGGTGDAPDPGAGVAVIDAGLLASGDGVDAAAGSACPGLGCCW
jgi:hypothetical protein